MFPAGEPQRDPSNRIGSMNMNMNTEWILSRQESYPILGVFLE